MSSNDVSGNDVSGNDVSGTPVRGGLHGAIDRLIALLRKVAVLARSPLARWTVGLGAVALAVWALVTEWANVVDALSRLDAPSVALAMVATAANVALAGLMWRAVLADLGSPLPLVTAGRVFFVGQLGKYLPGSVWPVVIAAELGHDHGVPRRRTATATLVALLVSVVSAMLLVLAAAPFVRTAIPVGFGWAVLLVVPVALALHPAVFGGLADRLLRLAGRSPMERRTTLRGMLAATAFGIGSWICAGVQVWALAVPLGAEPTVRTAVITTAGYALAWAAGFLLVVAPAGVGAREVALAAVLSPVLDRGEIVVVVLLSRFLFTAADLLAAGLGLGAGRLSDVLHRRTPQL